MSDRDWPIEALASGDLSLTDLGYLAGIFDGEGCVYTTGSGGAQLAVTITNSRLYILQALEMFWGGNIYQLGARKVWQWRAHHDTAESFLRAVLPYLLIKHSQAVLGIALNNRPNLRNQPEEVRDAEWDLRNWIVGKLKALKHLKDI